jgi:hypothetical protein
MGRPIKRKFFGSDNVNDGLTYSDAGGEGVSSVTVTNYGSNYSLGTTMTFAASPIGGTRATGRINLFTTDGSGNLGISNISITNAGTGYTSAPAVTLVPPANVTVTASAFSGNAAGNILTVSSTTGLYVGMHTTAANLLVTSHITAIWTGNSNVALSSGNNGVVSGSVTFYDRGYLQGVAAFTTVLAATTTTANTIQANAFLTTGTVGRQADIVSQRSSRKYRVTNADGTENCRLIPTYTGGPSVAQITAAGGPTAAGYMTLEATDASGGTYWVSKLEGRTATITPGGTGTPGATFAANAAVRWTSTGTAASVSGVKLKTND